MSEPPGQNTTALLRAALHRDGGSAVRFWRALSAQEQEEAVFSLLRFIESRTDLVSEVMQVDPTDYPASLLRHAGEQFDQDDR